MSFKKYLKRELNIVNQENWTRNLCWKKQMPLERIQRREDASKLLDRQSQVGNSKIQNKNRQQQ